MEFKDRLKFLRLNKKMTQEELGKKFNVIKQTISSWENGNSRPDIDLASDLADFFNVTIDYLLGRVPLPSPTQLEPAPSQFSDDELALIEKYRKMKDDEKDTMHKVANHIAPDEQAAASGK